MSRSYQEEKEDDYSEEDLRPIKDEIKLKEIYKRSKPTLYEYLVFATKDLIQDPDQNKSIWKVFLSLFLDMIAMLGIEIVQYRKYKVSYENQNEPENAEREWKKCEEQRNQQLAVFMCACLVFKVRMPKPEFFQDELNDDMEILNNLPSGQILQPEERGRIENLFESLTDEDSLSREEVLAKNELDVLIRVEEYKSDAKLSFLNWIAYQVGCKMGANPEYIRLNSLFFVGQSIMALYQHALTAMRTAYDSKDVTFEDRNKLALDGDVIEQEYRILFLVMSIVFKLPIPSDLNGCFNPMIDNPDCQKTLRELTPRTSSA